MVIWWLCWHRTILIRNITQKPYSQFPPVHDFGKPWWGVAYVPCMTNLRALCAWVIRWHVTCMLFLAEHWQGRRALSNNVCAHSVISMWHVVCLQHLARACSEQSRSTTVLPINHVIQMPQCLSGFVNHDYCQLFNDGMYKGTGTERALCEKARACWLWRTDIYSWRSFPWRTHYRRRQRTGGKSVIRKMNAESDILREKLRIGHIRATPN